MTYKPELLLQLFDIDVVNTSTQYVNPYTGVETAFSTGFTLSPELKTFYDTELLENARTDMVYAQFAKRQPLPANHGKIVEWRKWNTFAKASQLVEGVIPSGQKFGVAILTGDIDQYGTYTAVSDRLEFRAYDDTILGATEEMASSAAETQETLIRDALLTGTNVLYCDNVKDTDGTFVSAATTSYGMRNATGTAVALLTPDMVNKAVTKLKKDKAPTINGKYAAVIHPSVAYDLRKSDDWIDAHKYAAPEQLFNGEIGELHGTRFIEDVFAPVLVGDDLCAATRHLTTNASFATNGDANGTALTDSGDCGVTSAYYATVSDTLLSDGSYLGREILVVDVANKTVEASCVIHGKAEIVGVDHSAKKIYLDIDLSSTAASTDILVPGEGGKEFEASGQNAAYATFFFGKDAFGIIDPAGGALEMIVHDKSEIGGPLNQFSTIGYKFETNGATILYPERLLRVMSVGAYSATDEAN